jgi:hypothetical protein
MRAKSLFIEHAKSLYLETHETEDGFVETEHGFRTWFAEQIGVSRQVLDNWGKRSGILPGHIDRVMQITGLKRDEVRPRTLLFEITDQDWDIVRRKLPDVAKRATKHAMRRKYG